MKKFGWGNLQITGNGGTPIKPGVDEKAVNKLIDKKLTPVTGNLENLNITVEGLNTEVETTKSSITDIKSSVNNIDNSIININSDIEKTNNTLQTSIEETHNNLQNINNSVNDVRSTLTNTNTELNSTKESLGQLEGSIGNLDSNLLGVQNSQKELQTKVTAVESGLSDVVNKNITLEDNISLNTKNVEALESYIGKTITSIKEEYGDPDSGKVKVPIEKTVDGRISKIKIDAENADDVITVKSLDDVEHPRPGVLYLIDKPSNPQDPDYNGAVTDTSYHWVQDSYSPEGGHWDVIASSMLVVDEQGNTIQATSASNEEIADATNLNKVL